MALDITRNGIVLRRDGGAVTINRPGLNGGPGSQIEVSDALADRYRLATGDIVEGCTEPIQEGRAATVSSDECMEDAYDEEERDEPQSIHGSSVTLWLVTRVVPTEKLVGITRINGLAVEEACDRPSPRRKRSQSERASPERLAPLSVGPHDTTGRMLDFAAPLGLGYAGYIAGPHGAGLSRTLRAVVSGVSSHAPDCVTIVLLLRARSEELTDWRRRFPNVDVVVCPAPQDGSTPEQTLQMADLVLEAACRQTELGRHVLIAIDSLTALWGAMLEFESADAQANADHARARQRIREVVQRAGNFSGEAPLGANLGGSLTIIGTMWQQSIDEDAEDERELHPHLRLIEHILHETSWRVSLSPYLAESRLYPAIETTRCFSRDEERLLSPEMFEQLREARTALSSLSARDRYNRLMDTIDATNDNTAMIRALATKERPLERQYHMLFSALPEEIDQHIAD